MELLGKKIIERGSNEDMYSWLFRLQHHTLGGFTIVMAQKFRY